MIKVLLVGIGGRIGSTLSEAIKKDNNFELVWGIDKFADSSRFTVPVSKDFSSCNVKPDIIIDFSRPDAAEEIACYALANQVPVVFATTGYSQAEEEIVLRASKKIPVFRSANMSLGVNLLVELSKQTAKFLGNAYDVEIIEQHHNTKADSPSGTALTLANAINEEFQNKKRYVCGREGKSCLRSQEEIGIHAVRGGTVVGKHDVQFMGADEIITLSHEAQSKQVFAYGALRAAEFLQNKSAGLYSMQDIIGQDYGVSAVKYWTHNAYFNLTEVPLVSFPLLFSRLSQNEINVDMIAETYSCNSNFNLGFTVENANAKRVCEIISHLKLNYQMHEDVIKLVIEGAGMAHAYGIAGEVIEILSPYDILTVTTSETKISCCISADENTAVHLIERLKRKFHLCE